MSDAQSAPEDPPTETLRTFLYLDTDLANTLSAQLLDRPATDTEEGDAYPSRYDRLEEALGPTLAHPSPLHHDTVRNRLEPGHFLRVSGTALLEDYDMLGAICERWLEIADALVAAHVFQEYGFSGERELQRLRQEIKKLLSKTDDESRAKTLKSQLHSLPSDFDDIFNQAAKNMGMHEQKEWIEQHLGLFNDLFHGDSSSVSLTREDDEGVAFNAPLDDAHLRTEKGRLRLLYNGSWLGAWTLVGQVTALPDRYEDPGIEEVEAGGGSEHMRDNFRGMIGPVQEIYDSVYESESVAEVVLRPLALYRETVVERAEDAASL
ncbi:MAG: hypothetical protein BRD55_05760 [Bacteroidetes bacterium SW_9_63_38]|nr:MAG: hypothetical protein BRD55_05760 [Bacteroidetes bacterium SW_9_63_38]